MPASKNVMFLVSVTYTGYSDTVHSLLLTVELFFVPQLTFLVTFLQIPNANGVAVSVPYLIVDVERKRKIYHPAGTNCVSVFIAHLLKS